MFEHLTGIASITSRSLWRAIQAQPQWLQIGLLVLFGIAGLTWLLSTILVASDEDQDGERSGSESSALDSQIADPLAAKPTVRAWRYIGFLLLAGIGAYIVYLVSQGSGPGPDQTKPRGYFKERAPEWLQTATTVVFVLIAIGLVYYICSTALNTKRTLTRKGHA